MKVRSYLILSCLFGILFLVGCQPAKDSSMTAKVQTSPSAESLRLRVSAPQTIESILVEVRTTDVDTTGFGNLFNILSNRKVFYRDAFEEEDILIAIKPGTIEVTVYAFAEQIPVTGKTDVDKSLYFGKTEAVTVTVGEEKEVVVQMLRAVNVSIANLAIVLTDGQYSVEFETDPALPAGTDIRVLYNAENPDFLEYVEENNQVISAKVSGSRHTISLPSSEVTPYFVKVEIDSSDSEKFYRGSRNKFCDVCGLLPFAIYDRQIAFVDETSLSQGIRKFWKTTTYSWGIGYFSKSFFDQIFLTKQIAAATPPNAAKLALANLGIYQIKEPAFYHPNDASVADCSASACMTFAPSTESNAPSDFYDDLTVLISTQVTQHNDLQLGLPYYPNTADCTEELSRLGQDCAKIPRVNKFFLEKDRLFLDVFLGEGSRLEFYKKETGLTGTPVASVELNFPVPNTTGGVAQTSGIDYQNLLPDLNTNYFGRVVNNEFQGSLLDLNVSNWTDRSGISGAQVYAPTVTVGGVYMSQIQPRTSIYYTWELEAGKTYTVTIEGFKGLANLWEFYLIAPDQQTILKSFGNNLLGADLPEKTSITVTPTESGTHYLKITNPLRDRLWYLVKVK